MSKQQLIEDNMGLVYHIINKHYPKYIHDEDIVQEGMLGLCKAANTYDSEKSKFSTYAYWCILNSLRSYFKVNAKHFNVLSYDREIETIEEGLITFLDILEGDEDIDLGCMDFKLFYEKLNESDQRIIDLSIDHTETEISSILGISQPQVSRRKKAIKNKWEKFNGDN